MKASVEPKEKVAVTGLKRLYRGNSTAKVLLDYFASRDRNRETTIFNRVLSVLSQTDEPPTRAKLREVFRTLEKLGHGTYIVGRRGMPTRFVWSSPLIEVGAIAATPAKAKAEKPVVTKATRATRKTKRVAEIVVKRKPGRPRKNPLPEPVVLKRKPGRPRKEQIAA